MKKKLAITGFVIVGLALIGFLVLKIMTRNAERHVETEKAILVNAAALVDQYIASAENANAAFLNKTLQVSGYVAAVDTNANGQSVILLKGNETAGVLCTFQQQLTGIQIGDLVNCKGICTGFLSNVTLSDCILIDVQKGKDTIAVRLPDSIGKKKDTVVTRTVKTFRTSKAQVSFDAGGGVEDIKATNHQAEASITTDGIIRFKVPVLGFKFSDALMQQHFNTDFMESSKYPVASFSGNITNPAAVNFEKDGTYQLTVTGNLTLHGVTKKINTPATLIIRNGRLKATSSFRIKMEDHQISTDAASSALISISCNF